MNQISATCQPAARISWPLLFESCLLQQAAGATAQTAEGSYPKEVQLNLLRSSLLKYQAVSEALMG